MNFKVCSIVTAITLAATVPIAANADAVTPTAHPEKTLRAIGGGLYLRHDADLSANEDGNTMLMVFSHEPIEAAAPYSIDLAKLAGIPMSEMAYDGGTLGPLRIQTITIDCRHQTYEVIDTRKALPEPIWRAASTLPALAPLFQFTCQRRASK